MKLGKKILIPILMLAITSNIGGAAQQNIKNVSKVNYTFRINGESVDSSNYLVMSKDNTTYVPLRFLSEQLGAWVDFDKGTISVSLPKKEKTNTREEDAQKIQDLQRKLDLAEKENRELKKNLDSIDSKLAKVGVYKNLPAFSDSLDQMKITINNVRDDKKPERTSVSISVSNLAESGGDFFYLQPEQTILTVNGQPIKYKGSSGQLSSTLVPINDASGKHTIDGDLEFEYFQDQPINASITIFYAVNSTNTIRSKTIYFQK